MADGDVTGGGVGAINTGDSGINENTATSGGGGGSNVTTKPTPDELYPLSKLASKIALALGMDADTPKPGDAMLSKEDTIATISKNLARAIEEAIEDGLVRHTNKYKHTKKK